MYVTAKCHLISASKYSQSRPYQVDKKPRETPGDYEKRTWRERLHLSDKNPGKIVIPSMQFKNSLAECAKYMARQIPGKGKTTYTKHFEADIHMGLVHGRPSTEQTSDRSKSGLAMKSPFINDFNDKSPVKEVLTNKERRKAEKAGALPNSSKF